MSFEIDLKGAAKGAIIGGLGAGVFCVGMYFVGSAVGATYAPRDPVAMGMTVIPFFQPVISCFMSALAALGVLALLKKLAPTKAWNIFLVLTVLVFIGEIYAPFWAFSDVKTVIVLELMHLPATLGIVGGISRFGIKPAPVAVAVPA